MVRGYRRYVGIIRVTSSSPHGAMTAKPPPTSHPTLTTVNLLDSIVKPALS